MEKMFIILVVIIIVCLVGSAYLKGQEKSEKAGKKIEVGMLWQLLKGLFSGGGSSTGSEAVNEDRTVPFAPPSAMEDNPESAKQPATEEQPDTKEQPTAMQETEASPTEPEKEKPSKQPEAVGVMDAIKELGKGFKRKETDEVHLFRKTRRTGNEAPIMRIVCTGPFRNADRYEFMLDRSDFPLCFSKGTDTSANSTMVFSGKGSGINNRHFMIDINKQGQMILSDLMSASGIRLSVDGSKVQQLSDHQNISSARITACEFTISAAWVSVRAELLPEAEKFLTDRYVELTVEDITGKEPSRTYTLHDGDTVGRAGMNVTLRDEHISRYLAYIRINKQATAVSVNGSDVFTLADGSKANSVKLSKGVSFECSPYRFTVKDAFIGLDLGKEEAETAVDNTASTEIGTVVSSGIASRALDTIKDKIGLGNASPVYFSKNDSDNTEKPILKAICSGPFENKYSFDVTPSDLPIHISSVVGAEVGSYIVCRDPSLCVNEEQCVIGIEDRMLRLSSTAGSSVKTLTIGNDLAEVGGGDSVNLPPCDFSVSCGWIRVDVQLIPETVYDEIDSIFAALKITNRNPASDEKPFRAVATDKTTIGRDNGSTILLQDKTAARFGGYFILRDGEPYSLRAVNVSSSPFLLPDGTHPEEISPLSEDTQFAIGSYLVEIEKVTDMRYTEPDSEEATKSEADSEEATETEPDSEEVTETETDSEEATESESGSEEATESRTDSEEATESEADSEEATDSKANIEEATESESGSEEATESESGSEEATESETDCEEATESEADSEKTSGTEENSGTVTFIPSKPEKTRTFSPENKKN